MNDYLLELIKKYKSKGILVDTNIVLLYIVGSIDINRIRNHPRTAKFTEDDFARTSKFIDAFDIKITTPHVLTEVSDLLGRKTELQFALRKYIETMKEEFLRSSQIAGTKTFLSFGLADAAISETAKDSYLILTDDNPLFGFLTNQKIDAVNLSQIRMI